MNILKIKSAKGTDKLIIKRVLISFILIILSFSMVFCISQNNVVNVPSEKDIISGGYWYNEDRSKCFKFDSESSKVSLYSLNSGSYTYNFGNVMEGSFSLEKCTMTFGENTKYYVLDGSIITIDEEKFTLDPTNAPTLNTAPMESASDLALETPITLVAQNPEINEKIYLKFTPESNGRYLFDFAISDADASGARSADTSTTHIWILNREFNLVAQSNDELIVFLSKAQPSYVIVTVSAVSSETGTNTLTVTNVS